MNQRFEEYPKLKELIRLKVSTSTVNTCPPHTQSLNHAATDQHKAIKYVHLLYCEWLPTSSGYIRYMYMHNNNNNNNNNNNVCCGLCYIFCVIW